MKFIVTLLFPLVAAFICRADSKAPPSESIGSSVNGRFIVRLSSKIQVFELDKEEKSYRLLSEFSPVPEGMPTKALISDDGRYVVALDGGRGMGRGDDVVAVYEGGGKKLKSWRLDEILDKEDRAAVSSTTSAVWWRQEVVMASHPPQLIVLGPSEEPSPPKKRYWYQLDLATLIWTKVR